MRTNVSVIAIVFVLFLGSKCYLQGVRAYPPTDMKSHSLAVHNDDDNDGAIYIEPQHNKPIYIRRQTKQKNEHILPITSSVTATTNSTSSMPSTVKAAPATTEKPQLKSAFVYRAELPTLPETDTEHSINAVNTAGTSYNNVQSDSDLTKKSIGSSVVTSVSVVLNGDEPEFTDALGHKVPKPEPSLQVASPIDLLNPDRYEFFTFDEKGELVKRLMTMEQIQSIVANGDGDGPAIIHEEAPEDENPEKNVQSILKSVQNVLDKEVESNKNATQLNIRPVLDTPDVSSTWSMILPAIFGNTGDDIFPHQKPQQIVMTPDSEIIETYTKSSISTTASTRNPKPSKRRPGQKRKPTTTTTTTEITPQVVQEELGPFESVYTGMQQYQDLAATMQNFDKVSQFHIQPIYQKLPEATIVDTISMNDSEHAIIDESFSIRPVQLNTIKTTNINIHNGASSKRPVIIKHKIKKKPSTSTTTETPESPAKDSEIENNFSTNIELSTKASNVVNIESSVAPLIMKKKKKKPTRKPVLEAETPPLVDSKPNSSENQPIDDLPTLPIDSLVGSNVYQDINLSNTTTTSSTYEPLLTTTFEVKTSVTQSPSAMIVSDQQTKNTTPPPADTHSHNELPVMTEASNVEIPVYSLHILPLSTQESEETDLNHSFSQEDQDLYTLASFDKIMQSLTQSDTVINTFNESLNSSTNPVQYNNTELTEQPEEMDDPEKLDFQITTPASDIQLTDEHNSSDNKPQGSIFISNRVVTETPVVDKVGSTIATTLGYQEIVSDFLGTEEDETETSEVPSSNPFRNVVETTTMQDTFTEQPMLDNTEDTSYKSVEDETSDFTDQISTTEVLKDPQAENIALATSYEVENLMSHKMDPILQHEMVIDLQPALNMDVVKPTEQITMSDFQTQAATVASTLVDGSHSLDLNTMENIERDKNEIQVLMSDVIQQVAKHDNIAKKNTNIYNNRFSNIAQFNSSFLSIPPLKEILQNRTASFDSERHQLDDGLNNKNSIHNLTGIKTSAFEPAIVEEYGTLDDDDKDSENLTGVESMSTEGIQDVAITTTIEEESNGISIIPAVINIDQLQNSLQANTSDNDMEIGENKMEDEVVTDSMTTNESTDSPLNITTSQFHNKNENQSSQEFHDTLLETTHYLESTTMDHFDNHFRKENTAAPLSSSEKEEEINDKLENWNNLQVEYTTQSNIDETNAEKKSDLDKTHIQHEGLEIVQTEANPTNNIKITGDLETAAGVHETTEGSIKYAESEIGTTNRIKTFDDNRDYTSVKDTLANVHSSTDTQHLVQPQQQNSDLFDAERLEGNATNLAGFPVRQATPSQKLSGAMPEELESVTTTSNNKINEEKLEELNSTVLESHEFDDSFDEDPYIKLGETTQRSTYIPQTSTTTTNNKQATVELNTKSSPHNVEISHNVNNENHFLQPVNLIHKDVTIDQQIDKTDEEDNDDQLVVPSLPIISTTSMPNVATTTRRLITLKPVSYFNKQPSYTLYQEGVEPLYNKYVPLAPYVQQSTTSKSQTLPIPVALQSRPMQRPPQLSNLMAISTQATRPPVKLEPSPLSSKGLLASVINLDEDVSAFTQLCNELAFSYWKSITSEKISSARSLVISPFALTSMLSMIFLGARGGTSGEMNDVLKLDDMITFNPHLIFKNITESVEKSTDNNIATAAFVRELYSDRANGKIMQFFKEKVQQLYSGHVEEVNFHVVNDIIRRRTNLLIKRHTMGKVVEYLRTNSVWVNGPFATISANLFQTDCSQGSIQDRDGEMFFQVHPSVRQRRLVPIPAVLFKNGFTVGYEPNLDATLVAFGRIQDTLSTIYIMPGHQNTISPSDNLDRLEKELMQTAISKDAWNNLLTSLMDRPGMEVQLPRFSHRSFVNATLGLQKMGLRGLFKSDYADLGGLTGSSNRDIYLSDIIQINTFSTCGEERIADHHHVEMYPAPPLRKRNKNVDTQESYDEDSSEAVIDFGSLVQETALGRGFYDDLLDPKYLELPLPLRPRQARVPDTPRLRFDKPFLYFLRHNPTGMIMFIGRFNPRLLP